MSDYFQGNFPLQSVTEDKNLPISQPSATDAVTDDFAITVAAAGAERKAGDILVLKVSDISYLADYFVIMTGYSRVQVRAIATAVEDKIESDYHRPVSYTHLTLPTKA